MTTTTIQTSATNRMQPCWALADHQLNVARLSCDGATRVRNHRRPTDLPAGPQKFQAPLEWQSCRRNGIHDVVTRAEQTSKSFPRCPIETLPAGSSGSPWPRFLLRWSCCRRLLSSRRVEVRQISQPAWASSLLLLLLSPASCTKAGGDSTIGQSNRRQLARRQL